MKIQPYMISVKYDYSVDSANNGLLPIKEMTIENPVLYDAAEGNWYTHNYYRKSNTQGKYPEYLQVGIEVKTQEFKGITVHYETLNGDEKSLQYSEKYNIWYESLLYKEKRKNKFKKKEDSWISGIIHSGILNIIIKKNNDVIRKEKLVFYPNGISIEDYELMINDLFRIREDLIRENSTTVSIGTQNKILTERLLETLDKLENPLQAISDNPATFLKFQWEKEKLNNGEKFRIRSLLEEQINPGKQRYSVFKGTNDSDLIEHRMIKQQLKNLKEHAEFYGKTSKLYESYDAQYKNEMEIIEKNGDITLKRMLNTTEKLTLQDYDLKIGKLENEINFEENNIQHKKREIHNKLKKIKPKNSIKEKAYVEIKLKFNSNNFLIKPINKNDISIESIMKPNYDKKNWPIIKFIGYKFKKGYYENLKNANKNSLTIKSLKNFSSSLNDQYYFIKSFRNVKKYLIDNHNANVVIKGWVLINTTQNNDIIGERVSGKNHKDYNFKFESITSISLNNVEFKRDNENRVYEGLTEYLLGDDKKDNPKLEKSALENIRALALKRNEHAIANSNYKSIVEKAEKLLSLPLMKSIKIDQFEKLIPTQLFLHDPFYRQVWKEINNIEKEVGVSLIPKKSNQFFGVQKVNEIFELWSFYKIIHILATELGWELQNVSTVTQTIDDIFISTLDEKSKDIKVILNQNNWSLVINYEPKIDVQYDPENKNRTYLTPDYVFQIFENGLQKGVFYLDAKHRNYLEQGESEWVKDIHETSILKYGGINPKENKWADNILGSFILHSDLKFGLSKETSGENYHALYNNNLVEMTSLKGEGNEHKYGSIYMLPTMTHSFKNWFRMIMEYNLGKHNYCWSCGCEIIDIEINYTESGYEKYYYTCTSCNEFWVKSHCGYRGHKLIKHYNNYHRQPKDYSWFLVCPTCRDGEPN